MEHQLDFDGEEIFGFVEELVALGPRRTGTSRGRAAAEYVATKLRSFGITDVRIEETPSLRWDVAAVSMAVDGAELDVFPVNYSGAIEGQEGPFGTDPSGITGRLVDLDRWAGDAGALRGALVMFDVHFQAIDVAEMFGGEVPAELLEGRFGELYASLPGGRYVDPYHTTLAEQVEKAVRAGAAGFIAVLADYFDSNRYLNENYGGLSIPGVWVTRKQGDELRRRLARGEDVQAILTLHGSVERVTALSPVAVLPGASPETILVHSHHDSAFDGAVQDASGTSVVLALARHFASLAPSERKRTLMFATMDTHFAGYESHQAFIANHVEQRQGGREILADITIEHIARDGRVDGHDLVVLDTPAPRLVLTNAGPEVTEVIEEATDDLSHLVVLPTALLFEDELPTDAHYTFDAGLLVVSLISGPIYLYDQRDTLDKVDRSQLAPVASAFARLVEQLAALPRTDLCAR